MELDVGGAARPLVASEGKACLKPEVERPRCASTPCSPIRGTVAGYQILHMDSNYLVGFTTGEELLKLAHSWTDGAPDLGPRPPAGPRPPVGPKALGVQRSSRLFKAKGRYFQPYDLPAASGRRRRRMPSSSEVQLKTAGSAALHAPLPHCLLKTRRAQSKSLDYLNLDKLSLAPRETSDTEVLQVQLRNLTLRGERALSRSTS